MVAVSPILAFILGITAPAALPTSIQVEEGDYTAAQSVGLALQYPDYPAGCEPMSLCILLNSYEYDVSMSEIMEYFNRSDNNFVYSYWGDIYSEGAVYPPGVVMAANTYLYTVSDSLRAQNITFSSWAEIEEFVTNGKPLMTWTTMDFTNPRMVNWTIDGYTLYENEHCVVLYGMNEESVYISDPIEGLIQRPKDDFKRIWELCGSMAVMLTTLEEC